MSTFRLAPVPNLQTNIPAMPNALDQMSKAAMLKNMLSESALRSQLAPLQVQEEQQAVQQKTLQNQVTQEDLNNQVAFGKMFMDSEGDMNTLTQMISDPKQNYGLTPRGIGPALQQIIAHREAMYKMDEATAAHTDAKNNVVLPLLEQLNDAKQQDRPALRGKLTEVMKNAGMFSPQEIAAASTMDLDDHTVKWNLYSHYSQDQLLKERKAASEEASSQGTLLRGQTMASEFAAKTDPNSPFYDPSAAYLAKRAAAGDEEAKSILAQQASQAGAKAGAEAKAKLPYELQLKQQELAQNPVFAVNPKTGQRELTTVADAKANGYTNPTKVTQTDIEKESQLTSQVNDMQLNQSRYRTALNAMGDLSATDRMAMTHILSDPSMNNLLLQGAGFPAVVSMAEQSGKGRDWNALSPDKQDALIGYLRMKNTGLLAQKVLTGMGRASKEALDIELANMPSPIEGATVGNKKLDAWQQNIDQMASRTVKLPWMEQSTDVKARIEGQATQQYNLTQAGKQQGKYSAPSGTKLTVGQNIQIPNVAGLSRVRKVYGDGSFDADQNRF